MQAHEKQRIPFIDTVKGLMIICVIARHTADYALLSWHFNLDNSFFYLVQRISWNTFATFYMPSFFMITGMCTGFNKPAKTYILNTIQKLLLPAFFLGGVFQWFVCALIIDKFIYYLINRYIEDKYKLPLVIFASIVGCLGNRYFSELEYLYCFHAFGMLPFIYIGHKYKDKILSHRNQLIACFIYLITTIGLKAIHIELPALGYLYLVAPFQLPLHWILTISGALFIFFVSKFINLKLVKFCGKMSIVFFLCHFYILNKILALVKDYIELYNGNTLMSASLYLVIISCILIYCSVIAYLLDTKYGKYIMGRF